MPGKYQIRALILYGVFKTLRIEVEPNQRNDKVFSEGGHRKMNPKGIVPIINHIIAGKGVYKNTIVCVYKTLNSFSKKVFTM